MKIINVPRGKGKTTRLLYISEYAKYSILVKDEKEKFRIKEQAKSLNITIGTVYSVSDLLSNRIPRNEKLLVDEFLAVAENLIKTVTSCEVECATFTSNCNM